jgi:hypothetical protein
MKKHHTKDKGDIATTQAIADLTKKGYAILVPAVSEHLPFDFVAFKENKFYRIQAKYSSDGRVKGQTSWNDKHGTHIHKYGINDFDYYAIYLSEKNIVIYPSIKFSGSTFTIEVPNSATPFYWYEDFLNFTDVAEKKTYKDFGKEITFVSTNKTIEAATKRRKVIRPSKEELEKLLWQKPTSQLAKDFGVSDKAIEKWAKAYGLEKPGRGYWPSKTDLESWKKVFEEAQADPNFKVIVHH